MNQDKYFFLLLLIAFLSCRQTENHPVTTAEDSDFAEAEQVSPSLADGLSLKLWAPGPLLSNAVALTFDNQGVAYVAETERRKSSDLDIRAHRNWMTEDLALQSLEDTREFHLRNLSPENSEQNPWLEDFNQDGSRDYRDLEVQTEYIRRVWDRDGDGRADASELYADGFNDMLTGVAAGILYFNGDVYLTAAPDVYKLTDTNGDGAADQRSKISHGFGIHIAYAGHDMSGLTIGPDGRIYWSIGDIGVNAVGPDGKRWAFPNEGAVMRANPDGTGFEVFAHGLRNPQELAFDNYGNLISVDNDGDHPGEHERYVHIIEGSDSGWRINWQFGKYDLPNESYKVWMDEKLYLPYFPGQAAYITPPLALAYDGPAGLAFNPGTALGDPWKDYFFASYFTGSSANSKIQAFKINPKGASFEIGEIKDVVGGIVPTGITFAADGALYINDWKDSYDKKPTGRIWKLDLENDAKSAVRVETQTILQEGMAGRTPDALVDLLAQQDQRVRMEAQFELVKRKDHKKLLEAAENGKTLFARLHAIWGMGQLAMANPDLSQPLSGFLEDEDENVRAQIAKVIGEAGYQGAIPALIEQLKDPSPIARFFAAQALGRLGDGAAFQPLVDLLEQVPEEETHMRHAVVYALSRLGQAPGLADLATHPSRQVRISAVVALRSMRSPLVSRFLSDNDPLVLAETARAINDDLSIPEALPALAASLEGTTLRDEVFLRRAINANLRLGDAASAWRLASYATFTSAPEAMREDALWALGYWSAPPVLDRVDGRYRKLAGHQLADAQNALTEILEPLVNSRKAGLQAAVVTAAGRLDYQPAGLLVFDLVKNKSKDPSVRMAALTTLAQLKSADLAQALDLTLTDENMALRAEAQDLLTTVDLPARDLVDKFEKILQNNTVAEKQKALASLARIKAPEAGALLKQWWEKFQDKTLDPALQLDLLEAIENSSFDDLQAALKAYENTEENNDPLVRFGPALSGGDPQRGKRIFARNESAQCIRCHLVDGNGGVVGPDLTSIGAKLKKEDLLLSLVAPNARIAPGYGTVILKLKDGTEVAGILQEENEHSIKVKTGNDPARIFEKEDLQEWETLPSGMFNMSDILSRGQIRDLMAYLLTLK